MPGLDVDLYYYDNPGQEPEQMVNLQGEPYKSLPTAFAYRTDYRSRPSAASRRSTTASINLAALAGRHAAGR